MSKKKKSPQQQILSPAKYIRLKGRLLSIANCYVNSNWYEVGMASILVIRQHLSGNYTCGCYLVDTFCLGVKDTTYYFNITEEEMRETIDHLPIPIEISYNEVHNIIFGALTFAKEEAEVNPHPDFALTQYLLEEDTDDIPLIEYEFGGPDHHKPFLVTRTKLEANKYLPRLQRKFGEDIVYKIREEEEPEEESDLFSDLNLSQIKNLLNGLNKLKSDFNAIAKLTHTTYAYVHPRYPTTLDLTHGQIETIYNNRYTYSLPRQVIKELLALPRTSLIEDLNRVILYELGRSCDEVADDRASGTNALTHALFLLGELKATESLQTVLEILRQKMSAIRFHFQDSYMEVLRLTLYYIASNQTDALLDFLEEPGLDCYSRNCIAPVMATIAFNEPERREEVIEWFRQLLRFLIMNVSDSSVYDATLAGSIQSELLDIHAIELLPEIQMLHNTKQVNLIYCSDYAVVEKEMHADLVPIIDYSLKSIYQRYEEYENSWNR